MVQPDAAKKLVQLEDFMENTSQGMIVNSRAMVEKDNFVSTGIISAVEGDFVAIEIGEFMHFELSDLVKVTVYVPGGIRSFRSKIIAKDEGHLYIIHPPQVKDAEKREYPRIEVERIGMIIAMLSGGSRRMVYNDPLRMSVKNISASGIGFFLEEVHKLIPENVVEIELEFGAVFKCKVEIVRRETADGGFYYGAKFTEIEEPRLNSLRAFILKEQVVLFSKKKQVLEPSKKRAFR